MNKSFIRFLLLVLLLSACQPLGTPLPSTTLPPPATPVPLPTPTQEPIPLPTPTQAPADTATVPQPSATPGAGSSPAAAFKDCSLLPGLAACGSSLPLTGKLALIDPAGKRLVVIDFKAGTAWQDPSVSESSGLSFSPSGKQVLVAGPPAGPQAPSTVYDVSSGTQARSLLLKGLLSWTSQDTVAASDFRSVWSAAGDQAWIDFNTGLAHLRFAAQPDKDVTWPVSAASTDRISQAVAWVPGADLLLFEQHTAGNSMWVTGGSLYTLNIKNGAVKDLKANMALTFRFQWQPSAVGVMVYGDSAASPVMGGRSLYVLNVVTGSRKAVQLSDGVNVSGPAFTPAGQSILFGAALPAGAAVAGPFQRPAIYLENPAKPEVHALTQPPDGSSDVLPQLLPDSKSFLFFRVNDAQQTFSLRLGSLAGGVDQAVTADLPLPARIGPDFSFDSVLVYQP